MAALTIEEMREKVREADMANAVEADKAMKPYLDFVSGKTLANINKEAAELAVTYADNHLVSQKINALRMALNLFNQ